MKLYVLGVGDTFTEKHYGGGVDLEAGEIPALREGQVLEL